MSHTIRIVCAAFAFAFTPLAAHAAELEGPMFDELDACLDAAVKQQEGQLIRWQSNDKATPYRFDIDIVAPDDRVWTMKCSDAKVSDVKRKTGNKNYKMLQSRVKVPEKSARFTAAQAFPTLELNKMEYGLSWKGRPYWNYEMKLNDGREATVDVNAESGQIDRSHSERKS